MRVPPSALDAERSILAASLVEAKALEDVVAILRGRDDFYAEAHALTYEAMLALAARSQPIDHTTLRDELVRSGKLAQVGGDEFLFALTDSLPMVANVEAHASIVREKAQIRRLITACHEVAAEGYGDYGDGAKYLDRAEASIFSVLTGARVASGPKRVDVADLMRRMEDAANGKINPNGHTTGIPRLDAFTTGMHPGDLIVIAGRPGMGKSALSMGCGFAAAEATGLPVPYFSMEMQRDKCERRLLSMLSGVDGRAIKSGKLSQYGWNEVAVAAKRIDAVHFAIDDEPGLTLAQIRSRSRRLAAKHGGLACIVVDYLQLMSGSGRESSREQEVSTISRGLKVLAKEIGCPVVALSQLNRACEDRPDKRPQVSDLRESGAIEQDADAIWMVYRRGYYAAQMARGEGETTSKHRVKCTITPGEDDGKGEVIIGKQRDGSPGVVYLRFEGPCTRYTDPDHEQRRAPEFRKDDWIGGSPDDGSGDGEPYEGDDEFDRRLA